MQVYMIPTGMLQANSYLVIDDETKKGFVVDLGGHSTKMNNIIEKTGADIEYIIITHGHGDHIEGVPKHLAEWPNVKVVAAEAELPLLSDPALSDVRMCFRDDVIINPDIVVNDGDTLSCGSIEMKFIMTPGHTKGGMCIYIPGADTIVDRSVIYQRDVPAKDILFSGDTLFQASIGRTDFPGGSFPEIKASIKKKLYVLPDDTLVLPGHMEHTTIGFEKENNPFVF